MRKNFLAGLIVAFSIFGLFVSAEAETITKPNTFEDGTPALAVEVNANFDTVYDQVNKVGTEIHIDSANHRVGIGTTSPEAKLEISGEEPLVVNSVTAYGMSGIWGVPVFLGRKARGSASSPTVVQHGDVLGFFGAKGYNGNAFPDFPTAGISVLALGTHSESSQATRLVFLTTESGSITQQERMIVNGNGFVGIGTTDPAAQLETSGEGTNIGNFVTAYDGLISNDVVSVFIGRRARGSASSPAAVQSGDFLTHFGAQGYYGDSFSYKSTAGISIHATENYDDANQGSNMTFLTTSKGSITKQTRMKIGSSGKVGIGTTDPQSKLQVNGYIQLALTSGSPDSGDCDEATERGRMKVDDTAGLLYICVASGWVSK